jgi:RNA polymerase sigma-70 factor, ECF subfamily
MTPPCPPPCPEPPDGPSDAERRERFTAEALPLHAELERAARRYTENAYDAEDLVSETYLKAWAAFHTFQPGSNLRAWMHRILSNAWIDRHRRAQSRPREALTDFFSDAQMGSLAARYGTAPSAEEYLLHQMPSDAVLQAFTRLSAPQQVVVFYAEVCDLPLKQISELAGIPLGTVMSRIHRARHQLRAGLA